MAQRVASNWNSIDWHFISAFRNTAETAAGYHEIAIKRWSLRRKRDRHDSLARVAGERYQRGIEKLDGGFGLAAQLGNAEYARPRKFREKLQEWLRVVRSMWPECPARLSADGQRLIVQPAEALTLRSA